MGCEFGVRIKILEAASLYEVNTGVRDFLDYNTSMLDNSLFLDFLKNNGMKIINDSYSKDVICVAFSYGTRSFEEELGHIDKLLESADTKEREEKLKQIKDKVLQNKHKYIKKSKEELREEFYKNGCNITYITKKANGEIKRTETIHYRMLYRSTGKAKKGSCMFIRDSLYRKAKKFLQMGIKIPSTNTPIVELSAYMPLVTSTIIDKIKIAPENILIIKDIESYFKTNVVSVEVDENKHLTAKYINDYNVANVLFDGQALIDYSIFPEWGNGYILLRQHFCKMAAFKSDIQQFFKDYFKDDYENAKVVDMFGNVHIAKDIKLITTDNAMKWLKLGVDYSYWCDKVRENGSYFGVVKTAHKSKLGEVQRMSYQMVNTLDIDKMAEVTKVSVEYIQSLKNNDEVFLDYLRKNVNFVNDFDVLVALVEQNPKFVKSEYFKDRRKQIIKKYVRKFRLGRIIQNGENLTIVGSPYAMLLSSVGESINSDDTFTKETGCIQCYTKRFKDGEYLAEFRSPFNARNNMGCLHNVYSENIQKYFDLGCECIAINMIGTDFQARNNGSDMDSDAIYTTNQPQIVEHAKYCYLNYPTIVNNIGQEKRKYRNNWRSYSKVDNTLAVSQRAIGESSNLAQLALTYSYNFPTQKYQDIACILSVVAQISIDSAKRSFDIDIVSEIKRLKKELNVKTNRYPQFWLSIRPDTKKENINKELICPMNYLHNIRFDTVYPKRNDTIPMDYFFKPFPVNTERVRARRLEQVIEKYISELKYGYVNEIDEHLLLKQNFDDMIRSLQQIYISTNQVGIMSWLLNRGFLITVMARGHKDFMLSKLNQNKVILLKTLYNVNKTAFLMCWSNNIEAN